MRSTYEAFRQESDRAGAADERVLTLYPLGPGKSTICEQYYESLRRMAWERARGELLSMLATYHEPTEEYEDMETLIGEFIGEVEDRL